MPEHLRDHLLSGGRARLSSTAGIKAWINSDATAKTNNGGDDKLSAVTVMGYDAYCVALEAIKAAGSADPAAVHGRPARRDLRAA